MDIWDLKNTWRIARRCAKRASSYAPAIIETCVGGRLLQGAHYGRKTADAPHPGPRSEPEAGRVRARYTARFSRNPKTEGLKL
jgi:hypothetical protein